MAKVALLVVDLQKAFYEVEALKAPIDMSMMFAVNPALGLFRETGHPVFFVQHAGEMSPEGSPGFDLLPALGRREKEYQVTKRMPNSFHGTELAGMLKNEGVEFVVVCGLSALFCVNATIQGAQENGFKVALLQHGAVSHDPNYARVAHEIAPVISLEALQYFLKT